MTTKDQERKALEQIRKIVEGLGENSYVATAFEGCFEIAEDNIENDFACSMKDRAESAEQREREAVAVCEENRDTIRVLKEENQRLCDRIQRQDEQIHTMYEKYNENSNRLTEFWNNQRAAEEALKAAEMEIMKLKARLYDYMMKEAG